MVSQKMALTTKFPQPCNYPLKEGTPMRSTHSSTKERTYSSTKERIQRLSKFTEGCMADITSACFPPQELDSLNELLSKLDSQEGMGI